MGVDERVDGLGQAGGYFVVFAEAASEGIGIGKAKAGQNEGGGEWMRG